MYELASACPYQSTCKTIDTEIQLMLTFNMMLELFIVAVLCFLVCWRQTSERYS